MKREISRSDSFFQALPFFFGGMIGVALLLQIAFSGGIPNWEFLLMDAIAFFCMVVGARAVLKNYKTVEIDEKGIHVKHKNETIFIPFEDIESVNEDQWWYRHPAIHLDLKRPSSLFGKRINFFARHQLIPSVRQELEKKIVAARR